MIPGKYHHIEDNELLQRFYADHDNEWLGILLQRYIMLLLGVCMKYLKNEEAAKDSVQQIFLKVIHELKRYRVQYFKSWLYMIARNHCLMQLRAQKGKIKQEISENIMESALILHPEEEPELEQNLEKLENCIRALADGQQQCVRHFFLDEKCYKDICTLTGFDLNQVKSFIQNGKRNLKLCMERNV